MDEICRHLKTRDVRPDVIDEVVERLSQVGLLDDRAFARYWLENRSDFRPRGERALRAEDPPLVGLGRVAWNQPTVGMAIEFLHFNADGLDRLRALWRKDP